MSDSHESTPSPSTAAPRDQGADDARSASPGDRREPTARPARGSETSSSVRDGADSTAGLVRGSVGRQKVNVKPHLIRSAFARADSVDISTYNSAKHKHVLSAPVTPKPKSGEQRIEPESQRRTAASPEHAPTDRWFMGPSLILKHVSDAVFAAREEHHHRHDAVDAEKGGLDASEKRLGDDLPGGRAPPTPSRQTSHGFDTPGWHAPWTPFRRQQSDPFDRYTRGPSEGADNGDRPHSGPRGLLASFQDFLLYSAFAPLWLRLINLAFTAGLVGVAARIIVIERSSDLSGIIGISPIFALVAGSLTLVHVLTNLYYEYYGSPIGIWSISTKMTHVLLDLFFISIWAALLSIAFDDLYTTPAVCTAFTPNARWRGSIGDSNIDGTKTDRLCDLQGALVALTFVGMILYQAVLIVNLLRVFKKVSRKR